MAFEWDKIRDVVRPAVANWIWLADIESMGTVLLVGKHGREFVEGAERTFRRLLTVVDDSRVFDTIDDGTVDCVCVRPTQAELRGAGRSLDGGLREARRVVSRKGCLVLLIPEHGPRGPLSRLLTATPMLGTVAKIVRTLHNTGFRDVHPLYAVPDVDCFSAVVPAVRRAVVGYERWSDSSGRYRRVRRFMAASGFHHALYRSTMYLAYP